MAQDITDLPKLALAWHEAGRGVAIATVVQTWGSAPRPVGSQMVIADDGAIEGSVSGGCVEGAVITESFDALEAGVAQLCSFGVSDDDAFAVGLACGGEIKVLIEPVGTAVPVALLQDLVAKRAASQAVAYVTDLEVAGPSLQPVTEFAGKSGILDDGRTFVALHTPVYRMAIIGAVHIAQHLVPMAKACGYEVSIIDPRPAFATQERFPGTMLIDAYPDEAFNQTSLHPHVAVVTLSHDPKIDDPAIIAALQSDVFYIGCLGSTRTHAKRQERLTQLGFDASDIARIHGPVGLNIGGRDPAEIAVSIMAEVTQARHRPT